jgi:hypothetical protein
MVKSESCWIFLPERHPGDARFEVIPEARHCPVMLAAVVGHDASGKLAGNRTARRLISRLHIYALKSVAAQRLNRALSSLPAANQRQAPSCRSVGAVHHGHERSEFGRMQASRRPNQR